MELRKKVLIFCVIMSVVLFLDGISILALMNSWAERKMPGGNDITGTNEIEKEYAAGKAGTVNLVILGLDEEGVRSDVIILLNYNPEEGKLNILSIARDTRVRVKGRTSKINALIGIDGEGLVIKKIKELTGLPVNYYITLNFTGFKKVIDTLDGVEIDVPINMNYDDPEQNLHIHLKKGRQLLDGEKAEQFVRYRKGNRSWQGYSDGDIGRIKAQQGFIKALIDQKLKLRYLSKADDIFFILKKYMRTNIEIIDVNYYLKYLRNVKCEGINTYTLPGDPAYINSVWYFICDRKKTMELIDNNFFN